MKKFLRKLFGIDEIEQSIKETLQRKAEAEQEAEKAKAIAEYSKLSPKELATKNKQPWVAVLETHVNKENVRNGFFELDWNEYFVLQLREAGYNGSSEEEIVDKWFQELCRNVGAESDIDMDGRGSGYINRALRNDGKTEVS